MTKAKKTTKDKTAVGYARVSTTQQDFQRQRAEILDYCNRNDLKLVDIIECKASTSRKRKERGIDDLVQFLQENPTRTIVCSEVSRFGRSISNIFNLVEEFTKERGCRLVFVKEGLLLDQCTKMDMQSEAMLGFFALMAQIEKRLIQERTIAALAARKEAGVKLGRPAGKSKLDKHEDQIREWIELGVTQKKVTEKLGCSQATLIKFLKRKKPEWRKDKNKKK